MALMPYENYETEAQEAWLNAFSAKGWKLVRILCNVACFEESEPCSYLVSAGEAENTEEMKLVTRQYDAYIYERNVQTACQPERISNEARRKLISRDIGYHLMFAFLILFFVIQSEFFKYFFSSPEQSIAIITDFPFYFCTCICLIGNILIRFAMTVRALRRKRLGVIDRPDKAALWEGATLFTLVLLLVFIIGINFIPRLLPQYYF